MMPAFSSPAFTPHLLTPFASGAHELPNRMVMAPMTRGRAGAGGVPTPLNATYYAQRVSAGLLITEGAPVSAQGVGYVGTPGIYTPEQTAGWRHVVETVHDHGGRIFLQLWHVGRVSHPLLQEGGALPVAPSALAPAGQMATPDGPRDFVVPRALETAEVAGIVAQFRRGAALAMEAGFDGVELHGGHGYLFDQFLQDGANRRTDHYGGSIANRARLLLETAEAVLDVWGPGRVGVRLSPSSTSHSVSDSNPMNLFEYVVLELNRLSLAYLHLVEPTGPVPPASGLLQAVTPHFRRLYRGIVITNGGYDYATGNQVLADRHADLVSFGTLFVANPDLPARFAAGAPLNAPHEPTFHGGTEVGYTDYAFFGGPVAAAVA